MKKLMFASLALAVLLTGCGGRELAEVTLIQTIGVDGAGPVRLTAVGEEEETGPVCRQSGGEDLAQAREGLQKLGSTRLEVTHVAQLVLGPEVPVEEVLWQELTHRDSGYGATVWLCDRAAGELLSGAADPCGRLKALEENGSAHPPTILEAMSDLTREGRVDLPVLELRGQELWVGGVRTIEEG